MLSTDADAVSDNVDFYIHKQHHVLSQFPKPRREFLEDFSKVGLQVRRVSDVISEYGPPYYVKIDIEHYDHIILKEFFRLGVFPDYLSAECHSFSVVKLLTQSRQYQGYKVINGPDVAKKYTNVSIRSKDGATVRYSFPHHSAGPFGNDIEGPWLNKSTVSRLIALRGLGWKDLHASRIDEGRDQTIIRSRADFIQYAKFRARQIAPMPLLNAFRAVWQVIV